MQRRTLLRRLTAIPAAGALAGCLDDGELDEGAGGNGNETDDGDPDENGTDDGVDDDESGTDDGDEDEADDGDEDESDDQNGADDEQNGDGGEVRDERIETVDADCANGDGAENTASVSFEDDTVEIEGTIGASDPCHEAVLEDTALEDGSLTVTVTTESTGDDACQQCLGRLEYEATLEFDEPPERVTVVHEDDGETKTAAEADRDE